MPDILFHYERVNPTSWAYLSALLTLALYFKFNRFWSVRNFDLFLLILLAPGLLLVQWAWENAGVQESAPEIEYLGFVWLFATGGVLLARLLLDSAMVRRPLLEPNLNAPGLLFLGGSLLFFLMANVVTGKPETGDLPPIGQVEQIDGESQETDEPHNSFATDGPGYRWLYKLPRIVTQQVIDSREQQGKETVTDPEQRELMIRQATVRVMAILSHVMIVLGMVVIGFRHFDNISAGIASAVLYLLLPYTALWTGSVQHALPASLLVWAVVFYRRPLLAGMMIGLASGTIYYPAFLLPLWCSFYWHRGVKRFLTGVVLMITVLVMTMAFTATSFNQFVAHCVQMFGLRLPLLATDSGGVWRTWSPYYRYPILATFVALSISFAIWPTQKNLATLMSCTAAMMLATQFWHAYDGGVYIAWYLPLLLLTIFRPNLEDRQALTKLSEGWWKVRQRQRDLT